MKASCVTAGTCVKWCFSLLYNHSEFPESLRLVFLCSTHGPQPHCLLKWELLNPASLSYQLLERLKNFKAINWNVTLLGGDPSEGRDNMVAPESLKGGTRGWDVTGKGAVAGLTWDGGCTVNPLLSLDYMFSVNKKWQGFCIPETSIK